VSRITSAWEHLHRPEKNISFMRSHFRATIKQMRHLSTGDDSNAVINFFSLNRPIKLCPPPNNSAKQILTGARVVEPREMSQRTPL
jgi:hypothetical protein